MKRFLCGLLALCLLGCPRAPAAQFLTLRYQWAGDGVRLTLEGLEEEFYALQLELAVDGGLSRAEFTPAGGQLPELPSGERPERDQRDGLPGGGGGQAPNGQEPLPGDVGPGGAAPAAGRTS